MITPLDAFALATAALFLKMFGLGLMQGAMRKKHNTFAKPEDAEVYGSGEVADAELPIVDRAQRTLRNDLENIPIFLFLAWCYIELNIWPTGAGIYFAIFVASRFAHTTFYLKPTQPYRTISYSIGGLVCLALTGHIGYAVLLAP